MDEIIYRHFGVKLKELQREALQYLLDGDGDLLLNLPVGYGKSLIYQAFPFLVPHPSAAALVITPLNIIQNDQLASLKARCIPACKIDMVGSVCCNMCDNFCNCGVQGIMDSKFRVIYCHPESLFSNPNGIKLLQCADFIRNVQAVFIDECHVFHKWHHAFRPMYKKITELSGIFNRAKFVAMSGTLTVEETKSLPKKLGMKGWHLIAKSPDKENIFLEKYEKTVSKDSVGVYEEIFKQECRQLKDSTNTYPVTLMFIPMYYMSAAFLYLQSLFGKQTIFTSLYSLIYSGQCEDVVKTTLAELNKDNPRIRLVLTTSVSGMGFDPCSVTRIIHACPPRSLSQYLQEIGRCGRRGQASMAILYYGKGDISKNLPGITQDLIDYCNCRTCLRENLLNVFGFKKSSVMKGCECCSICKHTCTCDICSLSKSVSQLQQ